MKTVVYWAAVLELGARDGHEGPPRMSVLASHGLSKYLINNNLNLSLLLLASVSRLGYISAWKKIA